MRREDRELLGKVISNEGFDFVIFDVLNRMIPGLDENSAKEMAMLVSVLEELNRELKVTLPLVDHTRKPTGIRAGRNRQEPNPFDLKGSIAKYGCADFMICLSRTAQTGRLQVYAENKDIDQRLSFFVDVSPKDSGRPKFSYAGDVQKLFEDMRKLGEENRKRVLSVLADELQSIAEIADKVRLKVSTVRSHLSILENEGVAERNGKGRNTKWRRKIR